MFLLNNLQCFFLFVLLWNYMEHYSHCQSVNLWKHYVGFLIIICLILIIRQPLLNICIRKTEREHKECQPHFHVFITEINFNIVPWDTDCSKDRTQVPFSEPVTSLQEHHNCCTSCWSFNRLFLWQSRFTYSIMTSVPIGTAGAVQSSKQSFDITVQRSSHVWLPS